MGMKMKTVTYGAPTNQILAIPDHYVAIAQKHAKATVGAPGLAVLVEGRYVVKAGTIWPANDNTAVGIVLNDYDVNDGDAMMAIVVHGVIKTAALPAAPSADVAASQLTVAPYTYTPAVLGAKSVLSMHGITFLDTVA